MFARTERLMLRPAWAEDAPALARAAGDEAVARTLATAPGPCSAAHAGGFAREAGRQALPELLILARTHGSPRLIGGIGLAHRDGAVDLAYWITRPCWGLGFATEAAQAVIALAGQSLRIDRVVAAHALDNPAAGRVLRKIGFVATGEVTMRACRTRGALVPMIGYARGVGTAAQPARLVA